MEETYEINLKELLKAVWQRAWLVLLCALIAAGMALGYTKLFVAPTYKADVTMYVNNSSENSDKVSSGDLAVALQLVNTYVNIIRSDKVLERVVEKTGSNLTAAQVRSMLSAEVVDETEIFKVSIVSTNQEMAKDIVNAIAEVAPDEISDIIDGSSAKVIDMAQKASPNGPNLTTNTTIGFLVGAFLAIAVVVVMTLLDKRVHSESDLVQIADLPVLGVIPDFMETAKMDNSYAYVRRGERKGK